MHRLIIAAALLFAPPAAACDVLSDDYSACQSQKRLERRVDDLETQQRSDEYEQLLRDNRAHKYNSDPLILDY